MTTEEINTDDLNAAGLAVFGGTLQSDGFQSGVNGWRIRENDAEFGTLEIREGSINQTGGFYHSANEPPIEITDVDTDNQVGPSFGFETPLNVTVQAISNISFNLYRAGETTGRVSGKATIQWRRRENGSWESWSPIRQTALGIIDEHEEDQDGDMGSGAWKPVSFVARNVIGPQYEEVEFRLLVQQNKSSPLTETSIKFQRVGFVVNLSKR